LIPKGTLRIACPPGLHRATYARLIREYNPRWSRSTSSLRYSALRTLWTVTWCRR